MLKFINSSLRRKLLVSFFLVGVLPFIILLSYTIFLSETKIVNQTIKEQFRNAKSVATLIDENILNLRKEIDFIASLDLMDDILADDIDKRISILLSKKATDFSLDLSLFVVNKDAKIVASSQKSLLLKKCMLMQKLKQKYFIYDKHLYISSKIIASFDMNTKLGFLVLKYNLENLERFLAQQESMHTYIINPTTKESIGKRVDLKFHISKDRESVLTQDHVIVYEKLSGILNNYYLVYAVDKALALKFLYDFIRFMLYVSVVIFLLIIYISLRYSKSIVKPIEKLTDATQKIIKQHDYSSELKVDSNDEIAVLTDSFNEMLLTTSEALNNLEEENRLRLKRFVQLIEVFSTIIQTDSEDECIEVSLAEIKKITLKEDLHFSLQHVANSIDLYVTDFEKNEKVYFGSISLAIESFTDKNEHAFYNSIVSMITLQLDRIRLISRTVAVSKAKSAFISNMSHELRTPLNSIIGSTQFFLTYESLSDEQQDVVANIESSAHYLLEMINDILDIAKIEAGKMDAYKKSVDIKSILHESYNILEPLAEDKGLNFILEISESAITTFYTDPKILQQIVMNLLSNAIKFTEEGFVKLELSADEYGTYIKVSDSGIGIQAEDLEKLFSDFTQLENVMQKKHKGTGLGLSLSKKMANLLGGDIALKSEGIDRGSEATLILVS